MDRGTYRSFYEMPKEPPDWSDEGSLAAWIGRVRSVAFVSGARHGEIDRAEAREWLRWHGENHDAR